MEMFGVSRNTVRQAIGELEREGILSRQQGRGTFYVGTTSRPADAKTGLIGVLSPLPETYIFGELIHGMDDVAHQMGYSLVLATSRADPEREIGALENLLNKPLEGLIVEFAQSALLSPDGAVIHLLKRSKLPMIVCDTEARGLNASTVAMDDFYGGQLATEYLLDRGHRRIAMVWKSANYAGVLRRDGYLKALHQAGIDPDMDLIRSYTSQEETMPVVPIVKELLALPARQRPTALFMFNDQCAVQALEVLADRGVSVPDEISVMGFDDSDLAPAASVPLTTVVHAKYVLGSLAARMLIDSIETDRPRFVTRTLIRPTLAIRDSVRTATQE